MLPRSHARAVVAVALGLAFSMAIAVPASAAPESKPAGTAAQTMFVTFPDLSMLRAEMVELDSRWQHVPDSVTSWYVDPTSHSLVVTATDDAAARAFSAGLSKVRFEHVTSRPVPMASLHGGDKISNRNGQNCSIGFNAISGNSRYIITAGHCTEGGGTIASGGRSIGPVIRSSYPDNDYGVVQVTSSTWTQSGEVGNNAEHVSVEGVTPARLGDTVCRFGFVSGWRCGKIEAFGVTTNYGNGEVIHGLTRTSACSEPGDSGGPFMAGHQAQGVLSGADVENTCQSGGKTYFQPIREVLANTGLSLLSGRSSGSGQEQAEAPQIQQSSGQEPANLGPAGELR